MSDGLYSAILRATSTEETASALAGAPPAEVASLPVDTIEAVMGALAGPPANAKYAIAQSKLLSGLHAALVSAKAPVARLLELYDRTLTFGGLEPDANVRQTRAKTLMDVAELVAAAVKDPTAGVSLKALGPLCRSAHVAAVASIVASLGEKGADLEAVGEYAALVAAQDMSMLPADTLVRLMAGASKSSQVARHCLGPALAAAEAALGSWSMDDMSKLLFGLAKVKDAATNHGELLSKVCRASQSREQNRASPLWPSACLPQAAAAVTPQVGSLSVPQLIKVVLGVSKVEACRPLLEAAATTAADKGTDIPTAQLLLLTQGLAPLGGHPALTKLLDYWTAGPLAKEEGGLSGDQLAKLAQVLAPTCASHATLWPALGKRVAAQAKALTPAGQASLAAAFPDGGGPEFAEKADLLAAFSKSKSGDSAKDRDRDRDGRGGGGGDRDRDRRDGGDKDRRDDRDRKDRDRRSRDRKDKDRSRSRRRR